MHQLKLLLMIAVASKQQTRLIRDTVKLLLNEVGGWWVNFHGSPMTRSGVPDILGGTQRVFFALEAKTPNDRLSKLQTYTMNQINQGAGYSSTFGSPQEALTFIKEKLYEH